MKVLVAGVGGQGILMVTRVLAETAARLGRPVITSETHGMAQRGGSVVSHIKWGPSAISPLIAKGSADLLLGLDEDEGLRGMPYLRRGGRMLLNESVGKVKLPRIRRYLQDSHIEAVSVPVTQWALSLGQPRGTNLLLLGVAQGMGWIPFSRKALEGAILSLSRPPVTESLLGCLREGIRRARGLMPKTSERAPGDGG